MSQINVSNLTFGYENSYDFIFENVSFVLDTDWKLGFIGRNGKGKTTFLNLLLGKYEYEGSISSPAVFEYFPFVISEAQREECTAELLEEIRPGCEIWKVIVELKELELEADVLYRPYKTLSFGEQTKVMLAALFAREGCFLLIDEPTNHLDIRARRVIRSYLQKKKGFILVSHDRELLDGCVDHVLVLNRASIRVEKGNFSSWWENKERQDRFEYAENEKHRQEIRKLKSAAQRAASWADKNERTKIGFDPTKEHDRSIATRSYIGAKTKKMQSRVANLEQRISNEIEEKQGLLKDVETPADLKLQPLKHHKEVYVRAGDFGLSYGEKEVLKQLRFELKRGERVLLRGKNGCGKSSLIKAILSQQNGEKELFQIQGEFETAAGLVISYVNQDTSFLKGSLTDYAREHDLEDKMLKAILRQLDFDRVQFDKNMEEYSQGQKKKVLLAASLLTPAHLYIWDEPLNYIDVFSRIQIENLILKYQPTMLLVEHDSVFGEKVATRIVEL